MTIPDGTRTEAHPPAGKAGPPRRRPTRLSSAWVSMVLAAIFLVLLGILLVPGTGRIIQLRRTARRHRKAAGQANSSQSEYVRPKAPEPATRRGAGQ